MFSFIEEYRSHKSICAYGKGSLHLICMVKIPFLLDWVHRTHQPDMIVRGKGGCVGLLQYEDLSTQNLAPV